MTPAEAREIIADLRRKTELTEQEIKLHDKVLNKSFEDVPLIQHWVLSSAGPPRNGWTVSRWNKLHKLLKTSVTDIHGAIYRGTKFPWIMGGQATFKNLKEIQSEITEFLEDFDEGKPVKVTRIMPFTKDKKIAKVFASEAKGYKLNQGYTFDDGYIHIIESGAKGVDVAKEVLKDHIKLPDSDEVVVAKREKEVLIVPGTILIPVRRVGREFIWTISRDKDGKKK